MKVRSREINTISMSALDMFCSALGAFMFLAILFFAFVPNLGPKDVSELQRQLEAKTKALEQTKQERDAAMVALAKQLEQGETDIAIVIDASGSMSGTLAGMNEDIGLLARVLSSLTDRARISIVAYRDGCMGSNALLTLPFTQTDAAGLAQITQFTARVTPYKPDCNATSEEALYAGMLQATKQSWSAPADRRYIVVIGDQPPYPDEINGSLELAKNWAASGAHLSTKVVEPSDPATSGVYRALAQAGNGAALKEGSSFALSILEAMTK